MRKLMLFIALLIISVFSQAAVNANQEGPLFQPTANQLTPNEWNRVSLGGDTICSRGTDYEFFVQPADPQKLQIHFQGGGACWNGVNCSESPMQTFDDTISEDDISYAEYGLFDSDNPENPVGDYTTVIVTYCTGDIHVGNTLVDYDGVEIHHNGMNNAQAVLDWVYENYPEPTDVFVNGCSAGSYGSIFYGPQIAEHYAAAQFAHLGDAGIGVLTPDFEGLDKWGFFDTVDSYHPSLKDVTMETFTGRSLYESATAMLPDKMFTEYTAVEDEVQIAFYQLMGGLATDWTVSAQENLTALNEISNFASFTTEGSLHCIIPFPEFYEYETNGVRLVDWVSDLVAGEDVESVNFR